VNCCSLLGLEEALTPGRRYPETFLLESRAYAIRYNIDDSNKGLRREAVV